MNQLISCLLLFVLVLFTGTLYSKKVQPNIVFIFADDWGWGDLGCHGHPYLKTPNIDRLAREGTDFHRFTVASGVCSPSRTAVMTGHFPARYNIDGHFAWVPSNQRRNMPDWLDTKAPSLPRFLKKSGYATAHYGKWHLANDMIPDSPFPSAYGYDDYGSYNCAGPQMFVHDDVKSAIPFMKKSKESRKPFFINLWIHEPHTPFHVDPKLQKLFPDLEEADNIYAATLYHADLRIGQLLDALEEMKITENTLVIFSSDNGPARGAPNSPITLTYDSATGPGYGIGGAKGITGGRRAFKGALMEGGIGVPFIARWPGKIAAGKVDKTSVLSAVDLLPTFCELAGVKLPKSYKPDGISQVSTLMGRGNKLRKKPIFWKMSAPWPANESKPDHWVAYAVVHEQWKLVLNKDHSHLELYDLVNDPLESTDLAEKNSETVNRLKTLLQKWLSSIPAKPTGNVFSSLRES
ncbi:MAG: sulfatase-like hydrolase/transferase [Opitutae bacterium]|nr:sulfatase-like hydrolase/transferase [Opitutae bacterium]